MVGGKQQILALDISMHDFRRMQSTNSSAALSKKRPGQRLRHAIWKVVLEIVEQVPTRCILHDNGNGRGIFDDLDDADELWLISKAPHFLVLGFNPSKLYPAQFA